MKIAVFSAQRYDESSLKNANGQGRHVLTFYRHRLSEETLPVVRGFDAVCVFVNDDLGRSVLTGLKEAGVSAVALRCAGFNNIDLVAAQELGISVVRVPAYSPYAVAEHSMALILALNRKIPRAYFRVRDINFALDGLLGFDLNGKVVGVVGTGKIGGVMARILNGFGMKILAYDSSESPACKALGVEYTSMERLFAESDIITLHCPLLPETYHLIDARSIELMKHGVMLINTSRGALIDTPSVIRGLKTGQIGYLGLDVYEEESDIFFRDLSGKVLQDDVFARLLTFPNVIITSHQAFFTNEALRNIADTTLQNLTDIEERKACANSVGPEHIK